MSAQKTNYSELTQYIPQNGNEENYALLTHYLMMRDGEAKNAKRTGLIQQFGFEEEKLDSAEELYRGKHIPFVAQPNPSFTFIDLFAGIGGFRLAMQANGGECVFSSEWDSAAKQTYYENYGGSLPLAPKPSRSTNRSCKQFRFSPLCWLVRYPLCGGHPRNAPELAHGCTSRESNAFSNYHSCK